MDSQHHEEVDLLLAALQPEVSECSSEWGGIQAGDHLPENPEPEHTACLPERPEPECRKYFVGFQSLMKFGGEDRWYGQDRWWREERP